jgi:hypothetical protein
VHGVPCRGAQSNPDAALADVVPGEEGLGVTAVEDLTAEAEPVEA